jgi:hypothetical protein
VRVGSAWSRGTVTLVASARASFLVARNPDPDSSLPYLLRLPLDGGIELKARAPWPVTARVYCHPLDEEWPAEAEVVEQVAVRQCARRGRAIDLVLDRPRNNRSQFVFTDPHAGRRGGRPMIFWQTARTARRARPGQRVPTARAATGETLTVVVDTRERYPYKFTGRAVERERAALASGDYGVLDGDRLVAAVERKTVEDLVKSLVDGKLGFQLAELAGLPAAAVVVEGRYGELASAPRVTAGWPCELIVQLQIRYPGVPIVFADSRKLAEDWTHRFLAAAAAHHPDH